MNGQWLQRYGRHDQRHEFGDFKMNVLLVDLIHQHHNDGQFLEHFQRQYAFRNQIVLKWFGV